MAASSYSGPIAMADPNPLDKTLVYSEDRVKWRQLVHSVAKPRKEDDWRQGKTRNPKWTFQTTNFYMRPSELLTAYDAKARARIKCEMRKCESANWTMYKMRIWKCGFYSAKRCVKCETEKCEKITKAGFLHVFEDNFFGKWFRYRICFTVQL